VHVDITNYQDRYFGGAAMLRSISRAASRLSSRRWSVPRAPPRPNWSPAPWRTGGSTTAAPTAHALTWSSNFAPNQPGHGSLYFQGGQNPLQGAYLTTAANAPLNTETFTSGFTIEAFVKIPLDWNANNNSWDAVLSRWGESGQAGKSGGNTDPQEPIFTLSFSNGREPQCVFYPLNQTSSTTLWGQGLPEDTWWHVAVVNDGSHHCIYSQMNGTFTWELRGRLRRGRRYCRRYQRSDLGAGGTSGRSR
jgi:hypothetical protein